jgi:hypothetical protein
LDTTTSNHTSTPPPPFLTTFIYTTETQTDPDEKLNTGTKTIKDFFEGKAHFSTQTTETRTIQKGVNTEPDKITSILFTGIIIV